MAYLLDANVFIQGKRLHYGMDFCPAFWSWLIRANQAGVIFSVDRVRDELEEGGDDLSDWARERGESMFLPPDSELPAAMSRVSEWVTRQNYDSAAVSTFLQVADSTLVACALDRGFTVVTHELLKKKLSKIQIPNVCIGLGIRYMNTFEMLRIEKARFVLEPTGATR